MRACLVDGVAGDVEGFDERADVPYVHFAGFGPACDVVRLGYGRKGRGCLMDWGWGIGGVQGCSKRGGMGMRMRIRVRLDPQGVDDVELFFLNLGEGFV